MNDAAPTESEPLDAESAAAHEAALADDPATHVRQWLLAHDTATLCTLSAKRGVEGHPFGSVVPFALTEDGRPLILIARIAAHTANLRRDPRASLFVRQPDVDGDAQSGWRATLMGRWAEVSDADDALWARYRERVPKADGYRRTHDFALWQMTEVDKVRYIAGFGKICWLEGSAALRDPAGAGLDTAAPGAVAHMNLDHVDALNEMVKARTGAVPLSAEMTHLDRTGFFIRTTGPKALLHYSFGTEIDAGTLRPAVIEVLRRCRAARS